MKAEQIILVLSVIGMLLSGYLTYVHYVPEQLDSSFCNISDFLSCSTVNKSSYATLLGVPVALIGVIGFVLLGFLALGRVKYHEPALFYSSLFGLGFMVYLTSAELLVIKAVCILCVGAALIIAVIFSISALMFGQESIQFVKEIEFE